MSGYGGLCQDPGKEAVRGGVSRVCRASGWPLEHPLEGKAGVGGTRETGHYSGELCDPERAS